MVYLSKEDDKIQYFSDFENRENISLIKYEGRYYKNSVSFDSLSKPKFGNKADTVLNLVCKYASFSYFSNSIEVWYANHPKIKGSVYRAYLPDENSLVLKVVVNGGRALIADSIYKNKDFKYDVDLASAKEISDSEFEELKILSRYERMMVFDNDTLNFDPSIPKPGHDDTLLNKTYHFSKGTILMKKIKLPDVYKKGAYVYAKLSSHSAGDAYDRTGSLFMINPSSELSMLNALQDSIEVVPAFIANDEKTYQGFIAQNNFEPAIELMRFFTPFGVKHFNKLREINNYNWSDEVVYKQDITPMLASGLDEIWIGVFIGNYDKGGHRVSLELDFYPGFEEENTASNYVKPLFNTLNIMEMSGQNYGRLFKNDTLEVEFNIPQGLKNTELIYTTTGHGGWGGGDEFNPKLNQIFVDGKLVFSIRPWRTDCATYRMNNPASGNFGNGMSSSDFSRSNWCPGTLTPPYFIKLDSISAGEHSIKVVIDQGEDEGNSFSAWSVSGLLKGVVEK